MSQQLLRALAMLMPKSAPKITLVATAQTDNSSAGASLVINKPIGTVQGDLMIAVMARSGSGSSTWTGDTGWTEILSQIDGLSLRIAYKIAGASEAASYTFTYGSSVNKLGGSIVTYRNAAYDAIGTISTDATNPITATAVTVSVPNSLLLAVYAVNYLRITCSTPTGFAIVDTNADSSGCSWAIFSKTVGSGISGTVDSTESTANPTASVLLSLKPA